MKALTISQPYANLIACGKKPIENRRWPTNYRGPLAIHAGKGTHYLSRSELAAFPTGMVIAKCRLIACFDMKQAVVLAHREALPQELVNSGWNLNHMWSVLNHEHTEGPWCWLLSDVVQLAEPVPARGQQGLWEWHESSERERRGSGNWRGRQRSLDTPTNGE